MSDAAPLLTAVTSWYTPLDMSLPGFMQATATLSNEESLHTSFADVGTSG